MKTTTILRAYKEAQFRIKQFQLNNKKPMNSEEFQKLYLRQLPRFETALLSRIEAGDRAREALEQIIDTELRGWGPDNFDPNMDCVLMSDIARSALKGGDNWPWIDPRDQP